MNASLYINFATSIVTFIFGLLLLTGVIYPGTDSMKIMFGIVLMIYGVYRFINSISKVKQSRQQERSEQLIKEREKLFTKNG
ncbi:MAG: hypothetical protein ABIY50_01895 [Ignavibacteria bacterium]